MDLALLPRGLVIGFAIAAPVGPIGVLCIRRTLTDGRLVGFVTGLGAATADAIYGAVAAAGLTVVAEVLRDYGDLIRFLGGLLLCWLGYVTLRSSPRSATGGAIPRVDLRGAYGTTVALTLANPTTILSFAAVLAGVGAVGGGTSALNAPVLILGVFLGSAAWWLVLTAGVGALRGALPSSALQWVNRLSGLIIAGFGLAALATLAF
jgi:threonine/homoserine/homoserine lactone efflux protein